MHNIIENSRVSIGEIGDSEYNEGIVIELDQSTQPRALVEWSFGDKSWIAIHLLNEASRP